MKQCECCGIDLKFDCYLTVTSIGNGGDEVTFRLCEKCLTGAWNFISNPNWMSGHVKHGLDVIGGKHEN